MSSESRISFLEGALTSTNERLRDHAERFTELSANVQALRAEMNQHVENLRAEMNQHVARLDVSIESLRAENRATRRESRWISAIVVAALISLAISNFVAG